MALKSLYKQFNNPFISLKSRDFRIFWVFSGISSMGIWMQPIALSLLVYRLTDSPLLLGMVNAIHYLPYLLFSLFAGALIDRFPKKKMLFISHLVLSIIMLAMCLLIYFKIVRFWQVLALAVLSGLASAVVMPLRQVYIKELVDEKQLLNAVALYSTAYNLARIIGPALAGFIVVGLGIDSCNLLICLCFLSMSLAVLYIKKQESTVQQCGTADMFYMVKAALRYFWQDRTIRDIIYIVGLIGLFAINFSVLLPILSSTVLNKGEIGFGLLMSTVGAGSFLGAFTVASSSGKGPKRLFLYQAPLIVSVLLIFIGIYPAEIFIYVALALIGFFYVACTATATSALQLYSPPDYVGRTMSLFTLALAGTSPFGNLYSGGIANFIGVRGAFIACGAGLLLFYALYFSTRKKKVLP